MGDDQYVFLDTPGIHQPRTRLDDYMVKTTKNTIGEVDAAILVVEARETVGKIEAALIDEFRARRLPAILVINKTDTVNASQIAKTILAYTAAFPFDAVIPISAKRGEGIEAVIDECRIYLSESQWYFEADEITDQPERQIAAEVIREKMLRILSEEVPHGVAVTIEEFTESDTLLKVRAEIYCEKASHKGIIIGKNGMTLKTIGTYAREDLERFFGVKVFLDLWVRVKENWRDNTAILNNFGYREEG